MGPKKRDKVPIRRPHSSFKYVIPLGTTSSYAGMKKAIARRVRGGGYINDEDLEIMRIEEENREREREEEKRGQGEHEGDKGGTGVKSEVEVSGVSSNVKSELGVDGKASPDVKVSDADGSVDPTQKPERSEYSLASISSVSDSINRLRSTKRELFWLLKQVIQVEARRKREAKETITEGGPQVAKGGMGMGMGMGMGLGRGGGVDK